MPQIYRFLGIDAREIFSYKKERTLYCQTNPIIPTKKAPTLPLGLVIQLKT